MNSFKFFIVGCVACLAVTGCLNDGNEASSNSSSVAISSSSIVANQSVLESLQNLTVGKCFSIKDTVGMDTSWLSDPNSPCMSCGTQTIKPVLSGTQYYYSEPDSLIIFTDSSATKIWIDTNAIALTFSINDKSVFINSCDTSLLLNGIKIEGYARPEDLNIPGSVLDLYYDGYPVSFDIQSDDSLIADTVTVARNLMGLTSITYSYFQFNNSTMALGSIAGKNLYSYHWEEGTETNDSVMVGVAGGRYYNWEKVVVYTHNTAYLLENEGLVYLHYSKYDADTLIADEKLYYTADALILAELCSVLDSIPLGLPCK